MNLIKHLAKTKAKYIHPLGEEGTNILIGLMEVKPDAKILEIGCGTGATAEKLIQKFNINYFGVDQSVDMLTKAKKRKGVISTQLIQIKNSKLPFADHSFDIVFAESVLAIIEGGSLRDMLGEIYRVLKPSGTFLSNDSIWKEGTSSAIILEINDFCKSNFQLIQANSKWCDLKDWNQLFIDIGFKEMESIKLIPKPPKIKPQSGINLAKATTLLSPLNLLNEIRFKAKQNYIYEYGKYIEAYIFKMTK